MLLPACFHSNQSQQHSGPRLYQQTRGIHDCLPAPTSASLTRTPFCWFPIILCWRTENPHEKPSLWATGLFGRYSRKQLPTRAGWTWRTMLPQFVDTSAMYWWCHSYICPNQKPWLHGEVRFPLRVRDLAFKSRDPVALRAARRELDIAIKKAKPAYAQWIQAHSTTNNSQSMWKGIKSWV